MTAARRPRDDDNLPEARRHLEDAVSALIDPKPEHTDAGITWLDSLYDQLYDAIPGEQGAGNHAARSMPPLWADAVDMLGVIDSEVRKWQPAVPATFIGPLKPGWCRLHTSQAPTVTRLAFIVAERAWRPQDARLLDDWTTQLQRWAIDIAAKLTPDAKWTLPNPCPACNVATVYRYDAGDRVRKPALHIGPLGCECLNCHHVWGPQLFQLLASVLGYPLPDGVLQ